MVELIVVVAIILLLSTILFPLAGRMLRRAKEAKCAMDLSSLTKVATLIATDEKDYLPDLTRDPVSGAALNHQPYYWTSASWRNKLTRDYGAMRDHFYSASNDKWNRDDFWEWGDTHMVMGRFYMGSEVVGNDVIVSSMVNPPSDVEAPLFPFGKITSGTYYDMLWTDLNRQWPSGGTDNWITPGDPRRYGANHLYPDEPEWPSGSHESPVDGSVRWKPGDEIEHRVTHRGAEIYW